MKNILETVASESTPGKEYHIIQGKDGKVYCDCPSWIFKARKSNGLCKHLVAYVARGNQVVVYGIEEFMTLKRSGKLFVPDTEIKAPKIINVRRV